MSKLTKALTAAAGNAAGDPLYAEDVFSTYLYEGNSSTQTITNGIDLAGEGGLVWHKRRTGTGENHYLYDTERGAAKDLRSNQTNAEGDTGTGGLTSFNSNGFTYGRYQETGQDYASWTFRKAEKFFDVVTYTGDGTAGRQIAHNLGSAPAFVIVKRTNTTNNWICWHSALTNTQYIQINQTTQALSDGGIFWNSTTPDASNLTLGSDSGVNGSGSTYVAYLFASDAGGFGDDGSESIIKCGSFTGLGSTTPVFVDLGFEPQWVLVKSASATGNWFLFDSMRGMTVNEDASTDAVLSPNASSAEALSWGVDPSPTGFYAHWGTNDFIYIAIRRPMKTPESGTEVFDPNETSSNQFVTTGFPVDLQIGQYTGGGDAYWVDRLRGMSTSTTGSMQYLRSTSSNAEASNTGSLGFNGFVQNGFSHTLGNFTQALWSFKRATGFFDVVAYTGDGTSSRNINHNLGAVPELMIRKTRNNADSWQVYSATLTNDYSIILNTSAAAVGPGYSAYYPTEPTETVFTVGNAWNTNSYNMIVYLFATLAGVSKVGSYTGNGSNQTINCGFSAGARFVLIKGTTLSSNWVVFDSERGITVNNDPVLYLNSTIAEFTDSGIDIEPDSSGFIVNSGGN